jgi:hypothetical protein
MNTAPAIAGAAPHRRCRTAATPLFDATMNDEAARHDLIA